MLESVQTEMNNPTNGRRRDTQWPATAIAILFVITAGSLALRLYRLDAESLYMDEIVTVETFHRDPWGAQIDQPGRLDQRLYFSHRDAGLR